jgi:hypothetical protein
MLVMNYAVESAPVIQFPLFVAMNEHTKLYINMLVMLHNAVRPDRDQAC